MTRVDFIGYLISTYSFTEMEHHFLSIKSWKRWSNGLFWLVFCWGLKNKSFKILRKLVKCVFYGLFLGQNFEWNTAFFRITHFPKSLNPGQNFERKFRIFNEKSQFCRKTRLFLGWFHIFSISLFDQTPNLTKTTPNRIWPNHQIWRFDHKFGDLSQA